MLSQGLANGFNPNTLYYFFSTSAQAVAALVGLSSALAIFRYQNLLGQISDAAESLVQYFFNIDLLPYFPWDGGADAQRGAAAYRGATTANGHLNVLRKYLGGSHKRTESLLKSNLEKTFREQPKEVQNRLGVFRALKLSFDKYDSMVHQARRLRRLTIAVTMLGLTLVLMGLGATLSPDLLELKEHAWMPLFFLCMMTLYAALSLVLTIIAFADPLRER